MAPAAVIIRPKILPEEMSKKVPLSSVQGKILDLPNYGESSPSQPGNNPMPLLEETSPDSQNINTLVDEEQDKDETFLSDDATTPKIMSPGSPAYRNEQEGDMSSRLPGIHEEETTHAGNLFKTASSPTGAAALSSIHHLTEAVSSQSGSSLKSKGNLSRLLAPKAGAYQPIETALQHEAQKTEEPRRLVGDFPLQRDILSKPSQQRSAVDLGPVSIGLYPSKDPNTEPAVVVLPDHRRRHKPSFDDSITSIESLLPQLQMDDAVGGSSNASLASSSNSAAVLSRQSSYLQQMPTPPSYIGETPRKNEQGPVGLPSLIQEDAAMLQDGLLSLQSQQSHNPTAYYSAIGSLEDPTKLGSFVKNRRGTHKEEAFGRDFPSLVSATATHRAVTKRRSRVENKAMARRNSSGKSSEKAVNASDTISHSVDKEIPDERPKFRSAEDSPTKRAKRKELFRPSSDAYTPRIGNRKDIKFVPAEMRTPVVAGSMGTLHRPNYSDALRRVAMIIRQHIVKIECRFENEATCHTKKSHKMSDGLFSKSMEDAFAEEKFVIPRYRCTMVRVPMATTGMVCGMKRIREKNNVPTEAEIYDFASKLFKAVQLSSECSIVSLIYIERLMETARVPLLASTWRPIFMSGLLMASKVWQDLSSWNVEFSAVYPQYALENISSLELQFLRMIKWDLYISSSLYAKYYFALRSLDGKHDFRKRYNHMVGGDSVRPQQARKIEERTLHVKEEALQQLSRSM